MALTEPGDAVSAVASRVLVGAGLRKQLGEILVELGFVSRAELADAVAEVQRSGGHLGAVLVSRGILTSEGLARGLAAQWGLEYIALADLQIDRAIASLLPERLAREYGAIPVELLPDGSTLVAVADPTNVVTHDNLRVALGREVVFRVAPVDQLQQALVRAYRSRIALEDLAPAVAPAADEPDAPAIAYVSDLIRSASELGASDVHISPQRDGSLVQARVDGILRDYATIPRTLAVPVTARIKVIAQLDIAEKRVPQDGHFVLSAEGRTVDVRVAIIPTTFGEHVVLRLHDGLLAPFEIPELGMAPVLEQRFARALAYPHGAIIVCGPTGSGKTTTLYAALQRLNDRTRSLMTIEDPVERTIDGIVQVQVNTRAGLTFASGLRTILRADPDVLLVGEIRDAETADIAMKAALSGHLVLTSVHSPGAASALSRLRDLGVSDGVVANAIHCLVSQRLVRRLCGRCREPYDAPDGRTLFTARGCASCARTGYSGRVALYEILEGPELEAILSVLPQEHPTRGDRLRDLRADGLRLALSGTTTLEEVERVLGPPPEDAG